MDVSMDISCGDRTVPRCLTHSLNLFDFPQVAILMVSWRRLLVLPTSACWESTCRWHNVKMFLTFTSSIVRVTFWGRLLKAIAGRIPISVSPNVNSVCVLLWLHSQHSRENWSDLKKIDSRIASMDFWLLSGPGLKWENALLRKPALFLSWNIVSSCYSNRFPSVISKSMRSGTSSG